MTRARNIAGFSTITTTPSPVHVGPIGVLTATRIDGEFNVVDIATRDLTAQGIGVTNLQVSGITTGLNVSGIITAQNGINFNGTSTGLNVSGVGTIATLSVTGNATVGGVLTYEDVTRVDSVGVVTARGLSIFGNTTGLNVASGISTFQAISGTSLQLGTTVLNERAHIHTASSLKAQIQFTNTTTGTSATDGLTLGITGGEEAVFANQENTDMHFSTNNVERLRIQNDGLIGIGTDNPDTLLHAEGSGSTGITFEGSSSNTNHISGDAGTYLILKNKSATDNNFSNILGVDAGGEATSQLSFISESHSNNAGILAFSTRVASGSMTEALRITSAGKVGIATNNPTSPLHIGQSTDDSVTAGITLKNNPSIGAQRFTLYNEEDVGTHYNSNDGGTARAHIFETGGTERLRITSTGNIDVNGTPPWSVVGGDYRSLSISGETASSSGWIYLGNGAAATNADFDLTRINICNGSNIVSQIIGSTDTSANDDGRIVFLTRTTGSGSPTERLRITSTGLVQIDQGTAGGNHLKIKNDETSLLLGTNGTGDTYEREGFIGCTRNDSGSYPLLRIAGQGGIKFAVDANTVRATLTSSGQFLFDTSTAFTSTSYRKIQIGQSDGGWINLARTGVPSDGNHLGAIQGFTKGSDGNYHDTVAIDFKAGGTQSNSSKGTRIEFYTTPSNSTTKVIAASINREGKFRTYHTTLSTDYATTHHGWAVKQYFTVVIRTDEHRWYKMVDYAAGAMLVGEFVFFSSRNGGFNQTKGFHTWRVSYNGYNNNIYGTSGSDSGNLSTGHAAGINITAGGSPQNVYMEIPDSTYGGRVYGYFEGIINNWQFDEGTYLTSAP